MNRVFFKGLLKNKTYRKYVSIFAALIVVLFFVNVVCIITTVKKVNNQNVEASRLSTESQIYKVSNALEDLKHSTQILVYDSRLCNFVYDVSDTYDMVKIVNELNSFGLDKGIRSFITDVYIYNPTQQTIISCEGKYLPKQYYEMFIKNSGVEYQKWIDSMSGTYTNYFSNNQKFCDGKTVFKTIEYRQTYGTKRSQQGTIVVVINYDMFNRFCGNGALTNEAFYVVDNKNNVIYQVGNQECKLKKEYIDDDFTDNSKLTPNYVVFKEKSNGLKYISVKNTNDLNRRFSGVLIFDAICIIAFLIFGILLSLYFAYKAVDPIIKLENIIKPFNKDVDDTTDDNLYDRVISAFEDSAEAEKVIESQKGLLKNNTLRKLLTKPVDGIDSIYEALSAQGVVFDNEWFVISNILVPSNEIVSGNTLLLTVNLIKAQLSSRFADICRYEVIDDNIEELIIIFNFENPNETNPEIISSLNDICELITADYGVELNINLGDVHSKNDVYLSYYEMKECIEYRLYSGTGRLLQYSKLKNSKSNYFYNAEKEHEFIRYVAIGNADEALKCFDDMITKHSDCSLVVLKCLYFNLLGTMFKILDSGNVTMAKEIESKYEFSSLLECHDIVSLEKEIRNMITSICTDVNSYAKEKKNNLIEALFEYINKNYADNNMSLETIASEFGLNYTYVSHFFKEQTGGNFANYLANVRIQNAKQLLLETDMSIADIAAQVGYTNSTVFIRNFKKIVDLTPGQFRINGSKTAN